MLGIGGDDFYQNIGFGALSDVARLQTQRDQQNKALKAQQVTNTETGALAGAALGAKIGSAGGGPWGTAAGAAIGLIGGALGGHFL